MLIDNLYKTYNNNRNLPPAYLRNALEETLHYYLLQYISQSPLVDNLVFKGSSCLRVFFDLPRLSDNLNFDWLDPSMFDSQKLALSIKNHFISHLKFESINIKTDNDFNNLAIEFPVLNLLDFPLGPSDSNILRLQINITPSTRQSVITKPAIKSSGDFSFVLKRYSQADLMADKISTLLSRNRGYDFFDLVWFMEKGVTPNWIYFNQLSGLSKEEAISAIKDKVSNLNNIQLQNELEPYFPNSAFIRSFCQNINHFYDHYLLKLLLENKDSSIFKLTKP